MNDKLYCDPVGFRKQIELNAALPPDEFFNWFDGPKEGTINEVFAKAEDVFERLMLPWAKKYLKKKEKDIRTSLDFGYGSGGQVLAAAQNGFEAYGVDVHQEHELVSEELKRRSDDEIFTLLETEDGSHISLDNETIDFVHSWTTFMHLGTIVNVKAVLDELYRVMKDRTARSEKMQSRKGWIADIEKEKKGPGFLEGGPLSKVRSINIQIAFWYMQDLLKEAGLKYLDKTVSHDMMGRRMVCHGQHGIVFQK
jgi:hypothetical protein